MNFLTLLVGHSMAIHRLKKAWVAQVLFLIALSFPLAFFLIQPGDSNFSAFYQYIAKQWSVIQQGQMPVEMPSNLLSLGNLIYLACYVGVVLLQSLMALLYAGAFVGERTGLQASKGVLRVGIGLFKTLVSTILLILPCAFLSTLLWGIPVFVLLTGLSLIPLLYGFKSLGIFEGWRWSWRLTRTYKFSIFVLFAILYLAYNLASLLVRVVLPETMSPIVQMFFQAFYALSSGRLLGYVYLLILKEMGEKSQLQFNVQHARHVLDQNYVYGQQADIIDVTKQYRASWSDPTYPKTEVNQPDQTKDQNNTR